MSLRRRDPPGLWRALLRWIVPRGMRGEAMLGDLDQEFGDRAVDGGRDDARRWYRRQVVRIVFGYSLPRLLGRVPVPRGADLTSPEVPSILEGLADDVRYGARRLVRTPGTMGAAVAVFAIGTGATTAVFSVLDAVFFRPLPFPQADRIVQVRERNPEVLARGGPGDGVNFLNYLDYAEANRTFESMAFLMSWADGKKTSVGGGGADPELVQAVSVSPSFFEVTGHDLLMGRTFSPDERAAPSTWQECRSCWRYSDVAIISYELWQRRLGGDADVLGSTLEFEAGRSTVIGVTRPRFRPPPVSTRGETVEFTPDVYLPLYYPAYDEPRSYRQILVLGRLLPDVDLEEARADLNRVADGIRSTYPEALDGYSVDVTRVRSLLEIHYGSGLWAVLAIAGAVLLIACMDVANLLLARGSGRRTELAIRRSVGGGRRQLVRLLLVESVLLATVGAALGLGLAFGGSRLLMTLAPGGLPRMVDAGLNLRVLGFTLGLAIATGIGVGLLPALRSTDMDLGRALKGEADGLARTPLAPARVLVAGQVAMTLVLLTAGGVLTRSFLDLRGRDPGYRTERVAIIRVLRGEHHPLIGLDTVGRFFRTQTEILDAVRRIPGVRSAALGPVPRATGLFWRDHLWLRDYEGDPPQEELLPAQVLSVSPEYFRTMDIPIVLGRGLPAWTRPDEWRYHWWTTRCDPAIQAECPVVVSESFAEKAWPRENPIGKSVGLWDCCWTVVGVARDVRLDGFDALAAPGAPDPGLQVYHPYVGSSLVVRTATDPTELMPALRSAVLGIDPRAVVEATTVEALLAEALARPRFYMMLTSVFGVLALGMAMVGLYGVIAHHVSRRTREIGIRIALGAARDRVRVLVLRQALTPVASGLVIGLFGAWLVRDALDGFLFGSKAWNPMMTLGVAGVLTLVAIAAAYLPARRASSIEPVQALAGE